MPFFYGWVVVASAFAMLTVSFGVYYSSSVFNVALLEEFGWGRGATGGAFSLLALVFGLAGMPVGLLVDRFGSTRVVPAGALLLAGSLIATSRATEIWQFYLFYSLLCGAAISTCGWIPSVALVSRWFADRRGLAMGITGAGIGLGTVLMSPFNQFLISTFGFRTTCLVLAGIAVVGIIPQAVLLQVARPEVLGLQPDGRSRPGGEATERRPKRRVQVIDPVWASRPWSVGSAVRTSRFWLLFAMNAGLAVANQTLWVHQAAFLVDEGYDKMLAALVVGLAGLASVPAKIMWGSVADRLGREPTLTLGVASMVLALLMLVLTRFVPGVWLVFAFAIAFGTGYAVQAPLSPTAAGDVFAGRRFGSVFGAINMGTGVGSAFGAWWAGFVFDVTGSYMVALALAALCVLAGCGSMWLAAPRKVRRVVLSQT